MTEILKRSQNENHNPKQPQRRVKKGKDRSYKSAEPSMYGSEGFRNAKPFKPYDLGMKTPDRMALGAIHNKATPHTVKKTPSSFSLRRSSNGKKKKRKALESEVVDSETELSRWFMAGIPRDAVKVLAVELATSGEIGDFFIREKLGKQSTFALMVHEISGQLLTFIMKKVEQKRKSGISN